MAPACLCLLGYGGVRQCPRSGFEPALTAWTAVSLSLSLSLYSEIQCTSVEEVGEDPIAELLRRHLGVVRLLARDLHRLL